MIYLYFNFKVKKILYRLNKYNLKKKRGKIIFIQFR
jgi:hypothetical protein